MTLTTYPKVEQGSEEWYAARLGIVTASVVKSLVTPKTLKPSSNDASRGLAMLLASERITGWVVPTYESADMQRGHEDEPRAREVYSEHHAKATTMGFMVEDRWGFPIGYSPDGLVGRTGLIEIKSRVPKHHLAAILDDAVPSTAMAQIQTGLLVSGRKWCDYLSFSGGMPLWRKRVLPDPAWQAAIVEAVQATEATIQGMMGTYAKRVRGLPPTERTVYDEIGLDFS